MLVRAATRRSASRAQAAWVVLSPPPSPRRRRLSTQTDDKQAQLPKLWALPFALSSADALEAARPIAALSAHWDERGTLDSFGLYHVLHQFGITRWFGIGRAFEDDVVKLEQAAAIYVPTWIIDGALSVAARHEPTPIEQRSQRDKDDGGGAKLVAESANLHLVFENCRFPGTAWAPFSSLPLMPPGSSSDTTDSSIRTSLIPTPGKPGEIPAYEIWDPKAHLAIGRALDYKDRSPPVTIDGPITALPFELSPLTLPSFLKSSLARKRGSNSDSRQEGTGAGASAFTLSTRQPIESTDVSMLVLPQETKLISRAEARQMDGPDFVTVLRKPDRSRLAAKDEDGANTSLWQGIRLVLGLASPAEREARAKSATQRAAARKKRKAEMEELERRMERRIRLDPDELEVEVLAAYPVMLPMHILKFSYQPNAPTTPTPSSSPQAKPPRKTITVAVAGWDRTGSQAVRTLPSYCHWSRWGLHQDVVAGYVNEKKRAATSADDEPAPVPASAITLSPLQLTSFHLLPDLPVRVPLNEDEGARMLDAGMSVVADKLYGQLDDAKFAEAQAQLEARQRAGPTGPSSAEDEGADELSSSRILTRAEALRVLDLADAFEASSQNSSLAKAAQKTDSEREQLRASRLASFESHFVGQLYKKIVGVALQNSLIRTVGSWVGAAERDRPSSPSNSEEEEPSEDGMSRGWASYLEHQAEVLGGGEGVASRYSVPGVHLGPLPASSSISSPTTRANGSYGQQSKQEQEDEQEGEEDPALPDPSLLTSSPHILPFPLYAPLNRNYLEAHATRNELKAIEARFQSGNEAVFVPSSNLSSSSSSGGEGAGAQGGAVGAGGVGQTKGEGNGAQATKKMTWEDACAAEAEQTRTLNRTHLALFANFIEEKKPEWLRRLHDAQRLGLGLGPGPRPESGVDTDTGTYTYRGKRTGTGTSTGAGTGKGTETPTA